MAGRPAEHLLGGEGERLAVFGALVLVQALFGVHYLAVKVILRDVEPATWAALRAIGGAAVLGGLALVLRRPFPRLRDDGWKFAVFAVFGVIVNQLCFVEGMDRTSATHAALINATIPVDTLVIGVLLGRERATGRRLAALAVALAGVLLVIRPGPGLLADRATVGDLLAVANALSFSFFLVISKRVMGRTDPLAGTALLMLFGAVGLTLWALPGLARFDPAAVPAATWGWGAFVVLGPTSTAYLLNYWALARVDASVVGLFVYLQPVFATLLAWWFLGERAGPAVLAGGVLVLLGAHLALRDQGPSPRRE